MAHYQQLKFVEICKSVFPNNFSNANVIEIGSWNLNGGIRGNFNSCNYVGVDVASGPGVDLVCFGQDIGLESNSFDTAISCECFEHNEHWVETFCNMIRLLKPGGICIITCASVGRGEHGTSRCAANFSLTSKDLGIDYYRNLDGSDFTKSMLLHNFQTYSLSVNIFSKDLYFIGVKKSITESQDKNNQLILTVRRLIGNIKTEDKDLSYWSFMKFQVSWVTRYLLAKSLGETRYHNLIWFMKNKFLSKYNS